MAKKWVSLDTRTLGHDRSSRFDGFLHILPRGMEKQHFVDMRCWCDPRLQWSEEAQTVMVSHRDIPFEDPEPKPKKKKKW